MDNQNSLDPQLKEFIKFFDEQRKKDKQKYKQLISDVYNVCRFRLGESFQMWTDPEYPELADVIKYFDRMKIAATEENYEHMLQSIRDTVYNRMKKKNWFQRLFSQ